MKFRSKQVVIEAMQFDGTNGHIIENWSYGAIDFMEHPKGNFWLQIVTLEGTMRADVGDWIIRGLAGEFYPCKPQIFAAKYEPVEERDDT